MKKVFKPANSKKQRKTELMKKIANATPSDKFSTKQEFEEYILSLAKETGRFKIISLINSNITLSDRKTFIDLFGEKETIGGIIRELLNKSELFKVKENKGTDPNGFVYLLIGNKTELEGFDEGMNMPYNNTGNNSTGEDIYVLPPEPDNKGPKVEKKLKKEINGNMVQINESFCIYKFPVTQEIYEKVMGTNPSEFNSGPDKEENQKLRPVEMISYLDAIKFCNKLSELCGYEKCYDDNGDILPEINGFRLPTEKEWNFVANGGSDEPKTKYAGSENPMSSAWYEVTSNLKTHQVGLNTPIDINGEKIYDMSGNVWEMCETGHEEKSVICLGGSYKDPARKLELGKDINKLEITKEYKNPAIGFRICINFLKNN